MIEQRAGMDIREFPDVYTFDSWLSEQCASCDGVWIKFAKTGSGVESVTKSEAIDVALCHGWIDGQLNRYDDQHWLIRFTPRRPRSKWSQVNRRRAVELMAEGRMRPAGQAQVAAAKSDGRWDAAYAPASEAEVPADLQAALDQNAAAAAFFAGLTGASRYAILYRIGAVKKQETRIRKIAQYVGMLARRETLHS